jgi:hypothetical protein
MWLVRLYPPAWRRRYGRELADLIASHPSSLATAIDLIAGAIDAWLDPQSSASVSRTPETKGGGTMLAKMMRLGCAGYGPTITSADVWKSLVVTLGGTLALTVLWMWASRRFQGNPFIESFALMAFLFPVLLGLRYTSLKGRSAAVQAIFIFGLSGVLMTISVIATWLGGR